MSFTIKNRYLALGLILALLSVFAFGWGIGARKGRSSLTEAINGLNNEISRQELIIGDKTVYASSLEQEVTKQKDALRRLNIDNSDLRALNIKLTDDVSRLQFRIDTLLEDIGHSGQIVVVHDTITETPKNAIVLPFSFNKTDQWLKLDGTFDSKGKLDVSIKIDVNVDVITGIERKTKKPTISILTDNKYIQTVGIRSYKTNPVSSKKFGLGIQGGYGISKQGFSPYVGIGIQRTILRF